MYMLIIECLNFQFEQFIIASKKFTLTFVQIETIPLACCAYVLPKQIHVEYIAKCTYPWKLNGCMDLKQKCFKQQS